MPIILSAQKFCESAYSLMKAYSEQLTSPPRLHVYVMGHQSASWIYIRHKQKIAQRLGIDVQIIVLEEHLSTEDVIEIARQANADPLCDGILFQLPLSAHIDTNKVLNTIDPKKDVDGLNVYNQGLLAKGDLENAIIPCTPLGIIRLLKYYQCELQGKNILVIGRSILVGRPLGLYALALNATVTLAHSHTENIRKHLAGADIIVCATGLHPLLEWAEIQPHQIIIDVGIHRTPEGLIHGDMERIGSTEPAIAAYTPVPGSIGPMTIHSLMSNIFKVHALSHDSLAEWKRTEKTIELLTYTS